MARRYQRCWLTRPNVISRPRPVPQVRCRCGMSRHLPPRCRPTTSRRREGGLAPVGRADWHGGRIATVREAHGHDRRQACPMPPRASRAPGQVQRELFHNEAVVRGDVLFQPCVATISVDDSPSCAREYWTVRDQPIGARAVQPRSPAVWTDVGWLIAPSLGMIVWSAVNGPFGRFDGSGWSCGDAVAWRLIVGVLVVGVQQLPIRHPSGGVIIDGAARAAISTILAAPRSHGLIAPEIICGDAKPNLGKRVRLAPAGKRHDEVDQVWLFGNREGICVLARIFLFG